MEKELTKIKNDLKDVEHLIQRSTIIVSKDHSKISHYVVDSDIVLNLQNIIYNLQLCLFSKDILVKDKHKIEKILCRAGMVGSIDNKIENLDINQIAIEDKINEIIDKINRMENK